MDPVVHIGFEVLDVSHPMRKLFVFFLIPRLVAINYKCRIYCHFFWEPFCKHLPAPTNSIVGPFPLSAACLGMHSSPWWLMSGQEEKKSIPRLQCRPGDGWALRGLREVMGHEQKKVWSWMYEDRSEEGGWGSWDRGGRKRNSNMCAILRVHLCVFLPINTAS